MRYLAAYNHHIPQRALEHRTPVQAIEEWMLKKPDSIRFVPVYDQAGLDTYWIGNLRLVLDVEVQKGKAHAPQYGLPRLTEILERLPPERRPARVRGDSAFGNEGGMAALEDREQAYLSGSQGTCPAELLRLAQIRAGAVASG
jgi:hypothetical protein